ncbi:MAG TPA: cell envelope integrity protein TolA [Pararhizobium sp.]|nr:cell envelope integrity protein TolA [Pararhizobium sp.]
MKASLVTSAAFHALVICWALFSLSAPRTLNVADVDALPVDIIPVESITQVQKGEKKAPKADTPAPKPTIRPDPVENAQEIGNNKVDLKGPPTPKQSPKEVEAAAPPKQTEDAKHQIDDKAAEKPAAQPAPKPTEVASLPKPEPEPTPPAPAVEKPQPAPEAAQPSQNEAPEFASLPEAGPAPEARPQPPQPKTAEKPKPEKPEPPKKPEKKPDEIAKAIEKASSSAKKSDFNADKIAALLNREEAAGGGAKRSTQTASLGADHTTSPNHKLTQSEMDALRAQIQRNWNIIPGMADGQDIRVQVTMRLDPTGAIVGQPQVTATGGSDSTRRTLAGSAMRAVLMSSPFKGLPPDKYDAWSEVVVNFDPSQLY